MTKDTGMNGETKIILDEIKRLHGENKESIGTIFSKLEKANLSLARLPCKLQREKINSLEKTIGKMLGVTIALIVMIAGSLLITALKHVMAGQ